MQRRFLDLLKTQKNLSQISHEGKNVTTIFAVEKKRLMIKIQLARTLRKFFPENIFRCTHCSKFLGIYLCAVWFDLLSSRNGNWICD